MMFILDEQYPCYPDLFPLIWLDIQDKLKIEHEEIQNIN